MIKQKGDKREKGFSEKINEKMRKRSGLARNI